jgi:hypothetical protein
MSQNLANVYSIEKETLSSSSRDEGGGEKGGPKMKVSPKMLLKTHVEKMSLCGLAKMLLKQSKL